MLFSKGLRRHLALATVCVSLVAQEARASLDPAAVLPVWMEGSWATEDGRGVEHWHRVGGAMFGVSFPAVGATFEVTMITVTTEGRLQLTAWPGAGGAVTFAERARGANEVRFSSLGHDRKEVGYQRQGDRLSAFVGAGGSALAFVSAWLSRERRPAPSVERADYAFAADAATFSAAKFACWYEPSGVQWLPGRRTQGPDAIRALMRTAFEGGLKLAWVPRASGLSPRGDLGFTIGEYVSTSKEGQTTGGGYATIWRRQSDGAWKILFDLGAP